MICNPGRHPRQAIDTPWSGSIQFRICPMAWRCGTARGCFGCCGRSMDALRSKALSVANGRAWHLRSDGTLRTIDGSLWVENRPTMRLI